MPLESYTSVVFGAVGVVAASILYKFSSVLSKAPSVPEDEITAADLFKFAPSNANLKPLPIVYSENYDIKLYQLERFYPFDTGKWGKINNFLGEYFKEDFTYISPLAPTPQNILSMIHTRRFLEVIHSSPAAIAQGIEVYYVKYLPISFLQSHILTPIKWQVSGSVLAAHQALTHGWAINLGGGFHHASAHKAEGFCLFADISLITRVLWANVNKDLKFMIIDLDAHQGNGHERDVLILPTETQEQVYVFDMYHSKIFPMDEFAKDGIKRKVEIDSNLSESDYLDKLRLNIQEAFREFNPDLIIYNAGTDIMEGDPLGCLHVTPEGIITRDEIVFKKAQDENVPIVMLTSGGYQLSNARVIADSIINLYNKRIIRVKEE